jgi:hypothetical protein
LKSLRLYGQDTRRKIRPFDSDQTDQPKVMIP